MIRVLVMIAVTGFLLSVVTLSTAVAIGGPDLLTHGAWNWGNWTSDNDFEIDGHHWGHRHGDWAASSPQTSREIAWSGGDTLDVDVPADVQFTQAAGPGKLTVTGPKAMVDEVEVDGGRVTFRHHGRMRWGDLTIVMSAPSVTRFEMEGSGKIAIANYRQDKLEVEISGDGDVSAAGEAKSVSLNISGSGSADLGKLKAQAADVEIDGSGDATLAPTDSAKVDISGSGDVTLLTRPARLESNVSGSGTVEQRDQAAEVTPSPSPSPSPSPKHGKRL
jgi:hypothetical protein